MTAKPSSSSPAATTRTTTAVFLLHVLGLTVFLGVAAGASTPASCSAGFYSAGEAAAVTCIFPDSLKNLQATGVFVTWHPLNATAQTAAREVVLCHVTNGSVSVCESEEGYRYRSLSTGHRLLVDVTRQDDRFAGRYACHLVLPASTTPSPTPPPRQCVLLWEGTLTPPECVPRGDSDKDITPAAPSQAADIVTLVIVLVLLVIGAALLFLAYKDRRFPFNRHPFTKTPDLEAEDAAAEAGRADVSSNHTGVELQASSDSAEAQTTADGVKVSADGAKENRDGVSAEESPADAEEGDALVPLLLASNVPLTSGTVPYDKFFLVKVSDIHLCDVKDVIPIEDDVIKVTRNELKKKLKTMEDERLTQRKEILKERKSQVDKKRKASEKEKEEQAKKEKREQEKRAKEEKEEREKKEKTEKEERERNAKKEKGEGDKNEKKGEEEGDNTAKEERGEVEKPKDTVKAETEGDRKKNEGPNEMEQPSTDKT